ncbi:MAG: thioredoxin family protein, partial [Fimbriimonadaceae bacterium]
FMMGLTFAMTSFTCTVAFVGSVLAIAADGHYLRPIVGMLAFSTTFALPFFFLALFPSAIASLPKSGGWMQTVKGFMGFLELAAALKFFQNADIVARWGILTYPVFITLWFAIFLLGGLYLLGWMTLPGHSEGKPGPFRWVFGIASIVLAVWLLGGLQGKSLGYADGILPPRVYPGQEVKPVAGQADAELVWIKDDYAKAAAQAQKEGKQVLIDFTGYSCVNCRWMEANMFPRKEVKEAMSKYVLVQIYTDDIIKQPELSERNSAFQKKLTGSVALPAYVIVGENEKPLFIQRGWQQDEAKFVAFLNQSESYKIAKN